MTDEPIAESGMTFGPYPKDRCFHIEKSTLHQKNQQGVKMAEFLLLRLSKDKPSSIWIVEAKSSTPRPHDCPSCEGAGADDSGKPARFETFIEEIKEKMINAFSLGFAACLRRHETSVDELPESFKTLDFSTVGFRFVLVVKGHPEEWLPPLQEALDKSLRSTVKTWALKPPAVAVINDEAASQYGLIKRPVSTQPHL